MVGQMPDGKAYLSHCLLLAIAGQHINREWQFKESLHIQEEEHDLLNVPIDMEKVDKLIPAYERMTKEYKRHLKETKVEKSGERAEFIFNKYVQPFEVIPIILSDTLLERRWP